MKETKILAKHNGSEKILTITSYFQLYNELLLRELPFKDVYKDKEGFITISVKDPKEFEAIEPIIVNKYAIEGCKLKIL